MQKGLDILANYFKNTGISIGEKNGWIKGSATTLGITLAIGSGVYFVDRYKKYRAKKELELTEEKIIETLKEASEQDNKNIDSLEYEEEIFNEKSSTLKETFNDCVDKELM